MTDYKNPVTWVQVQTPMNPMPVAEVVGTKIEITKSFTKIPGHPFGMPAFQYSNIESLPDSLTETEYVSKIDERTVQFLKQLAARHDNACFGVDSPRNANSSYLQPFNSLFHVLKSSGEYGSVSEDEMTHRSLKELRERTGNPATAVVVAHPSLIPQLIEIKDDEGKSILQGDPGDGYTLMGSEILWTKGACRTESYDKISSKNDRLLFFVNDAAVAWGVKNEVEYRFIPASINSTALEHVIQYRTLRGFTVNDASAASVVIVPVN